MTMRGGFSLGEPHSRFKYTYLLLSFLVLVALGSLPYEGGVFRILSMAARFALVFSALYAVSGRGRILGALLVLAAPTLAAQLAALFVEARAVAILQVGLIVVFCVVISGMILRDLLAADAVTADTIQGAIGAYMLLGLTWAFVYALLNIVDAGSFSLSGVDPAAASPEARAQPMVYFSFVTLTTLGYGEIVPVTQTARTFCWIEAACGQIYLAVLVARLVGLHIAQETRKASRS